MFGQSDLRKTTLYQEVKEEIREELKRKIRRKVEKRFRQEVQIEVIPRLLAFGLTPEQIAYALDLNVKVVNTTVLKNYMVIS